MGKKNSNRNWHKISWQFQDQVSKRERGSVIKKPIYFVWTQWTSLTMSRVRTSVALELVGLFRTSPIYPCLSFRLVNQLPHVLLVFPCDILWNDFFESRFSKVWHSANLPETPGQSVGWGEEARRNVWSLGWGSFTHAWELSSHFFFPPNWLSPKMASTSST